MLLARSAPNSFPRHCNNSVQGNTCPLASQDNQYGTPLKPKKYSYTFNKNAKGGITKKEI